MTCSEAAAHVSEDGRPQPLCDHLRGTSSRAEEMADAFGCGDWGRLAGLWHDLGKYSGGFQRRLHGERISVEHSGAGAALAFREFKDLGLPLAFAIAGHHAGVANLLTSGEGLVTPLKERISANEPLLAHLLSLAPGGLLSQPMPQLPAFLKQASGADRKAQMLLQRRTEFWIRFLFSVLVDADRLDTEEFTDPSGASLRGSYSPIRELRARIDDYIDDKVAGLSPIVRNSVVNQARARVLAACRGASTERRGFFTLTVPTGGGKTLSAMSFALRHAEVHGLRRVVVVIPYTSIIEQNAAEYRGALGPENVIEHHSNVDPTGASAEGGSEPARRRELACENWDAPVIVTTSVQFFETLFSSRASRCRKLHSIARSVVILDEVQTLPPGFLLSMLEALSELVANYGCSIVLSTATPPALAAREGFEEGLQGICHIIPDSLSLDIELRRVEYSWPRGTGTVSDWAELAEEVAEQSQVLVVVHRRADARLFAQRVKEVDPQNPVYHLSALMCPAHRIDALARVREVLRSDRVCRVVSTQLVEAGVDIDFPVVYRALGGLDSVVQAAGRCNREGRWTKGRVVVFHAPSDPPRGTPRRAMEITHTLLNNEGSTFDAHDPCTLEKYFRMLYFAENLDSHNIQSNREQFNFATVGREFRIIEDGFTQSIVVPYQDAEARLRKLRGLVPTRNGLRGLQQFTVGVYPDAFDRLLNAGALEQVADGIFALTRGFAHLYDPVFGLVVGDEPAANPEAFMA